MCVSYLLVLFFCFCYSIPKWHELESTNYNFKQYVKDFHKSYNSKEYKLRKSIFDSRLKEHKIHNSNPTKSWKVGINQFTDQTEEEVKVLLGGKKSVEHHKRFIKSENYNFPKNPSASVDWRQKGIITPVKDQGRCGSCWAFAAAETLESYFTLAHPGQLPVLSEQQILDCTPNPLQCGGTGGCGGATVEMAYQKIQSMGGLSSEWTYPYQSYFGDAAQCNTSMRFRPVAKISGYANLPSNQAQPIISHIQTKGPLAISVDANTWFHYESGVYDGCNQTNPDLDHAVQLVGLGTDSQFGDYWLIRNSWTAFWGENGYIRLRRTAEKRCGVDLTPLDGDGCVNGSKTIYVCGTCGILYDAAYPIVAH